jgi:nucleoid DNA-binding protein
VLHRSDLVAIIVRRNPWLGRRRAKLLIATIFETIIAQLASGGNVRLRRFGAFSSHPVRAYERHDPRTGKRSLRPARRKPHFKPSLTLARRIAQSAKSAAISASEKPAGQNETLD